MGMGTPACAPVAHTTMTKPSTKKNSFFDFIAFLHPISLFMISSKDQLVDGIKQPATFEGYHIVIPTRM
jgi:hypothetical protein